MDEVELIKERLPVEDVVGDYLELKRAGRNLKALSPFTNENTPSFIVSPDKQIWHDFSANKGGDIYTFVQEVEGLDFRGALELLAKRAGVELSSHGQSDTSKKRRAAAAEALKAAAKFYQQQLLSSESALEYVTKSRGFRRQVIEDFNIGYAPANGKALSSKLLADGISEQALKDAGLSIERRGSLLDMFRDRVLVALADRQGQIVGFTGRLLSDDANGPKYINTSQTKLYDKSRNVFGLHLAKEAVRTQDLAIVVEGNFDVVSAHQAGSKNVVATAGTALTVQQIKQVKYLSENIAFAFDSDDAGLRATLRSIPLAQKQGLKLFVIELPDGQDPDDIISENPDDWRELVEQRSYAVDWVLRYYSQQFDLTSATGKVDFSAEVFSVLAGLEDEVERDHYLREVAELTNSSPAAVERQFAKQRSSEPQQSKKRIKVELSSADQDTLQTVLDSLLSLTLANPAARISLEQLGDDVAEDEQRKVVLKALKNSKRKSSDLRAGELKNVENFVKMLELRAEEEFLAWDQADAIVEADQLALRLSKLKTDYNRKQLSQQIAAAEHEGDDELVQQLIQSWQELTKED